MKKLESGFAHILLLLLLIGGLVTGVILVQKTNIFKSRAGGGFIAFVDDRGNKCYPESNTCSTTNPKLKIELYSTLGSPAPKTAAAVKATVVDQGEQLSMQGFQKTYGSMKGQPQFNPSYDTNDDGRINIRDFSILRYLLRRQAAVTPTPSKPTETTKPEGGYAPITQVFTLQPGWNIIGFTVDPTQTYYAVNKTGNSTNISKAENLLIGINQRLGSTNKATQIIRWVSGRQVIHTLGQQANNFDIKAGEGYQVRMVGGGRITFTGTKAQVTEINIPQGFSVISLPQVPSNINTAEKLLQEMKKQGLVVKQVSRWVNGAWKSHIINTPADFPIEEGQSYMVMNSGLPKTFKITLASVSPSPVPSISPISGPVVIGTKYYRIAETPTELDKTPWALYTVEPTVIQYTLKNSSLGQKFIWVEFQAADGKVDRRSASITLKSSSVSEPISTLTPTRVASPSATPRATPTPTLQPKRVFMTSISYNGNLGGLTGADSKCQARSNAASLGGTWKAWLSDSNTSASSRLDHYNGPYNLLNGTKVANSWSDLVDGTLQNAINITEFNTSYTSVWPYQSPPWIRTNTNADGSIYAPTTTCSNWTSNGSNEWGGIGYPIWKDFRWTNIAIQNCGNTAFLYCFEQ